MTTAFVMTRAQRSTFRTVVVGLLMLATLLVYAVPGHASLVAHHPSSAPVHEHAPGDAHDHAAMGDHDHGQPPCGDLGLLDDDACCSVAQCVTMHGGLPAMAGVVFLPRPDGALHLPALATPEGIVGDPALRPPCPTV